MKIIAIIKINFVFWNFHNMPLSIRNYYAFHCIISLFS